MENVVQCPYCGYTVADRQFSVCPNCGNYVESSSSTSSTSSDQPPAYPPYPSYPSYPTSPEYPGYAVPPSPTSPPSYGQPGTPSQSLPGYGQPGTPSQSLPGYGQPGRPSQGLPGYPYGYPPGYAQPIPGEPAKRPNTFAVVVGIILAVAVVAGLLAAGLLALSHPQSNTAGNPGNNSTVAGSGTASPTSNLIFSDPLTSNAHGWNNDQHCFFRTDGYHVKGDGVDAWECFAPTDVPNDFSAQVKVKEISGASGVGYGIVFRHPDQGDGYLFLIDGYGHWSIQKCSGTSCSTLSDWASSGGVIHAGINEENVVKVNASGSHFVFFANGKQIGQISDTSFTSGDLGLTSGATNEAVFTDLVINQTGG
jgi:hypothetical protein